MQMKVMLGELVEEKDSATEGGRVNEYFELQVNNLQQWELQISVDLLYRDLSLP